MSLLLLSQWVVILLVAIYTAYKGTDIALQGVRNIGSSFGFSSRYYESVLVGIISALPVLALAVTGVFFGHTAIVVPTIMGSTLISLLFIGGIITFTGGSIVLREDCHNTTVSIFCLSIALFVISVLDGVIDRLDSLLLLGTFCIFVGYVFFVIYSENKHPKSTPSRQSFTYEPFCYLLFGIVALGVGSKFAIDMALNVAADLKLSLPLLGISVLAFGATVPTIVLVLQSLQKKDVTFAFGIIIGAVTCTLLMVSSVTSLWSGNLVVGDMVRTLGVPILIAGSISIVVSALSKQFIRPVGLMMLLLFLFYILKLAAYIG